MVDHFRDGWGIVSKNPVAWVLYFVVLMGVASVTMGLGILLGFNAVRGVRAAIEEDRGPDVSDLFVLENLQRDLPALVIFFGGIAVGSAAAGIGGLIAQILLGWTPLLATEDRFASGELWKISLKAAQEDWQELLVFSLIAGAISFVSMMLCGLPFLLALPVCAVAQWKLYESHRDRLLEIGAQEGIALLESSAE